MKEKHSHKCLYWIAGGALLISIVTFFLFWFRLEPFEFSNDSFIGTIATFIGVCATFIVGFQIFNSMQVRNELKDAQNLIEELEGKVNDSDNILNGLKGNIEQINLTVEEQEALGIARTRHIKGYALSDKQLTTAYFNFIEAIDTYLRFRHRGEFTVTLEDLNVCVNQMNTSLEKLKVCTDTEHKNELLEKFECEMIPSRNINIKARIDSWKTLPEYGLLLIRFEYLETIETERKRIVTKVLEIYNTMQTEENEPQEG